MFGRDLRAAEHRRHMPLPQSSGYTFERIGSAPRVAGQCSNCDGMGRETYETDSGSLSTQTCTACGGTGVTASRKQASSYKQEQIIDAYYAGEFGNRVKGIEFVDNPSLVNKQVYLHIRARGKQRIFVPWNGEWSGAGGSGNGLYDLKQYLKNWGKHSSRRTAFLDTVELAEPRHRVAGWNWDDHLNGFVAAEAAREFTCACGDNVPAPGYTDCRCGKRWNTYTIQANGSKKMIAREVPVRENVVMANRRTASMGDYEIEQDQALEDWIAFLEKKGLPRNTGTWEPEASDFDSSGYSGEAMEYLYEWSSGKMGSRKRASDAYMEELKEWYPVEYNAFMESLSPGTVYEPGELEILHKKWVQTQGPFDEGDDGMTASRKQAAEGGEGDDWSEYSDEEILQTAKMLSKVDPNSNLWPQLVRELTSRGLHDHLSASRKVADAFYPGDKVSFSPGGEQATVIKWDPAVGYVQIKWDDGQVESINGGMLVRASRKVAGELWTEDGDTSFFQYDSHAGEFYAEVYPVSGSYTWFLSDPSGVRTYADGYGVATVEEAKAQTEQALTKVIGSEPVFAGRKMANHRTAASEEADEAARDMETYLPIVQTHTGKKGDYVFEFENGRFIALFRNNYTKEWIVEQRSGGPDGPGLDHVRCPDMATAKGRIELFTRGRPLSTI